MEKNMKFKVYSDKKNEWRWNLRANNNRKMGDSGEGYKTKASCLKSLNKFISQVFAAKIEIVEPKTAAK